MDCCTSGAQQHRAAAQQRMQPVPRFQRTYVAEDINLYLLRNGSNTKKSHNASVNINKTKAANKFS